VPVTSCAACSWCHDVAVRRSPQVISDVLIIQRCLRKRFFGIKLWQSMHAKWLQVSSPLVVSSRLVVASSCMLTLLSARSIVCSSTRSSRRRASRVVRCTSGEAVLCVWQRVCRPLK
jgi:hypothetical protein